MDVKLIEIGAAAIWGTALGVTATAWKLSGRISGWKANYEEVRRQQNMMESRLDSALDRIEHERAALRNVETERKSATAMVVTLTKEFKEQSATMRELRTERDVLRMSLNQCAKNDQRDPKTGRFTKVQEQRV